jgi:sugar/nucleoside kinase (ribokinase family)
MADCDIVVAGHLCLDITPEFAEETTAHGTGRLTEILRPGTLLEVGRCVVSTGGAVSNTGIALHKLGTDVRLMGKVGDDAFGEVVQRVLQQHGCGGAVVVQGEDTSYTIVIAPPGIDRMFLHNPGANDTFGLADVDFKIVAEARMFHLGYPPLMARLYADGGAELAEIFRRARDAGATTSLDMAMPDPEAASGRLDWRRVFQNVLPHVDLLLPSIEEVLFCLQPGRFAEAREQADAEDRGVVDVLTTDDCARLAQELIDAGAAVVGLKAGHRGMYLRTAGVDRLRNLGRARPGAPSAWADRELWEPVYAIDRVASATGAGDCAIAGFLAAFLHDESVERCLRYASATGLQNLRVHDATSGTASWQETTAMLKTTPKTRLELDAPGWRWDEDGRIWRGPAEG